MPQLAAKPKSDPLKKKPLGGAVNKKEKEKKSAKGTKRDKSSGDHIQEKKKSDEYKDTIERGRKLTRRTSDCRANIPAPNNYNLKNLVGYYDHDSTKWREPAYTMGIKHKGPGHRDTTPGPKYNVRDTTRHGRAPSPAFTMGIKHKDVNASQQCAVPGPSAYCPEKFEDPRHKRAPSVTLRGRLPELKSKFAGPSPGQYNLPGGLGASDPTAINSPTAIFVGAPYKKKGFVGPGPNKYGAPNVEPLYRRAPTVPMGTKPRATDSAKGPGPGNYNPGNVVAKSSPAFSFGIKHSKCSATYRSQEDDKY